MVAPASSATDVDDLRMTVVACWRHLPIRIPLAAPLGDDDLFDLCAANHGLHIERTSDGELIILPPTGGETGRRNFDLIGQFYAWVQRDGTGVGFDSSTGFLLPDGAERAPDIAWVQRSRWNALTADQRRKFPPVCPDFVLELRSPVDTLASQQAKLEEYLVCGARLGWLIDPEDRRVHVYRPDRAVEVMEQPSELRGYPELPGLILDLRSIW
ncbi:MAG TPA: Uma2 family endonuclease [Kofleriaceae bacterium]|nr:Uma2 family endonuclease [Kofleriaceae bacterium]